MRVGERPGYRLPAGLLLSAVLGTLLLVPGPTTTGAWLTSHGTAAVTLATRACGDPTPYAAALQATTPASTLWWRFSEPAGSGTVSDETGNGHAGTVIGAGAVLGDPGVVVCDPPNATSPGGSLHLTAGAGPASGFVVQSGPAHLAPPQMALAVWLRAPAGTIGALASFTDSATGAATRTDRVLSLDGTGRVGFRLSSGALGVQTTTVAMSSADAAVTDGEPHLVVVTIRPGSGSRSDVTLYVDGTPVDTATNIQLPLPVSLPPLPLATVNGYWRTGGGTGATATGAHLDELAVWEGGAPSAAEITQLYDADHW